ncbi:MAG: matrixin family metalloprotease [Polyangiaceae bacterium]
MKREAEKIEMRSGRWLGQGSKRARALVAAALGLAGFAAVRSADAYCRTTTCPQCDYDEKGCPTGQPIYWPSSCVTFAMQYRGSKQVDLATATRVMDDAFAVWQETACPDGAPPAIHVDRRFGDAACDLHEYNQTDANANIVTFRDDRWPYEASSNVLALTTVTYSRKTGAIFDVDMEINSTQRISVGDPVPSTSYDLQSIVTHEAGHFLGMAHTDDRMATMYPQYTSGTQSFRSLGVDDQAGICAVYPSAQAAKCDYSPRQGFSPECGIFPSGNGGKCAVASRGPAEPEGSAGHLAGFGALIALVALSFTRRRA